MRHFVAIVAISILFAIDAKAQDSTYTNGDTITLLYFHDNGVVARKDRYIKDTDPFFFKEWTFFNDYGDTTFAIVDDVNGRRNLWISKRKNGTYRNYEVGDYSNSIYIRENRKGKLIRKTIETNYGDSVVIEEFRRGKLKQRNTWIRKSPPPLNLQLNTELPRARLRAPQRVPAITSCFCLFRYNRSFHPIELKLKKITTKFNWGDKNIIPALAGLLNL